MVEAEVAPSYGVIVIDGGDAVLGSARGLGLAAARDAGTGVTELKRLRSEIHSRTCKGGQSQNRYQRLRDEAELAFLRKVSDQASVTFANARGLVLAGPADMKRKLQKELTEPLRRRIIDIVDLSCGVGRDALRQAAVGAHAAAAREQGRDAESALERFMQLNATLHEDGVLTCYGEKETLVALEMGAVEQLLLPTDWLGTELTSKDCRALAKQRGTQIIEVQPTSERAVQFCQAYGIAGCLRWPLSSDHLETDEVCLDDTLSTPAEDRPSQSDSDEVAAIEIQRVSDDVLGQLPVELEADCKVLTLDRTQRSEMLAWLESTLTLATQDASAASALTACADVLLPDEEAELEESTAEETSAAIREMLVQGELPLEVAGDVASRCSAFVSALAQRQQ